LNLYFSSLTQVTSNNVISNLPACANLSETEAITMLRQNKTNFDKQWAVILPQLKETHLKKED